MFLHLEPILTLIGLVVQILVEMRLAHKKIHLYYCKYRIIHHIGCNVVFESVSYNVVDKAM